MPHGRHIKDERKEIGFECFSLDVSSHQTWDEAFNPATPQDLFWMAHHTKPGQKPMQVMPRCLWGV
jgi:hypothetical protein